MLSYARDNRKSRMGPTGHGVDVPVALHVFAPDEFVVIGFNFAPHIITVRYGSEPSSVKDREKLPKKFALDQNYPNPFNPRTTIGYEILQHSKVELRVYNLLGDYVTTLVDREHEPGRYTVVWDGRNAQGFKASSGIYFYRLRVQEEPSKASEFYVETRKLILLK